MKVSQFKTTSWICCDSWHLKKQQQIFQTSWIRTKTRGFLTETPLTSFKLSKLGTIHFSVSFYWIYKASQCIKMASFIHYSNWKIQSKPFLKRSTRQSQCINPSVDFLQIWGMQSSFFLGPSLFNENFLFFRF